MTDWRWISAPMVMALHDAQIAEHGGLDGVRSLDAVLAALARAETKACYVEPEPDAAALAAAYAYGLARSHGFSDGNKRTAWLAARLFLAANGYRLVFGPHDAIRTMLAVAAGDMDEEALAQWFRERLAGLAVP